MNNENLWTETLTSDEMGFPQKRELRVEPTFSWYQNETSKTNLGKGDETQLYYLTLGIGGEAGEVQEKVKKILRNKGGKLDEEDRQSLAKELGDVLWYMSELATLLELDLGEIAQANIMKLRDRYNRGVIRSEGDNR